MDSITVLGILGFACIGFCAVTCIVVARVAIWRDDHRGQEDREWSCWKEQYARERVRRG